LRIDRWIRQIHRSSPQRGCTR